jgi:CelD/BcsL family acetyltransferase involved in cellulose biosynthesis
MHTTVTRHIRQLDVSRDQWNRLLRRSVTNTVFQTYEWFDAWWRVFGHDHQLLLITAYDGEDLVGLAPLMVSRDGFGQRQLRFVGDSRADYLDLIVDQDRPEITEVLLEHACALSHLWDQLQLKNIPGRSPTTQRLETFCEIAGFRRLRTSNLHCPALVIEGHADEARRIAGKYSLRRPHNRMARAGELVFRHVDEPDELQPLLEAFFDQHVRRWQGTDSPSLFQEPRNRQFFRLLAQALLPTGWLLFSVVEFKGAPAAFHFGFDYGGSVIWYKPSFDPELHQYSPGLVLLKGLIDYSIDNDRREFDFTIGDEPFKERYANTTRYNTEVRVYRRTSQYFLHSIVRSTRSAVKQAIRG